MEDDDVATARTNLEGLGSAASSRRRRLESPSVAFSSWIAGMEEDGGSARASASGTGLFPCLLCNGFLSNLTSAEASDAAVSNRDREPLVSASTHTLLSRKAMASFAWQNLAAAGEFQCCMLVCVN